MNLPVVASYNSTFLLSLWGCKKSPFLPITVTWVSVILITVDVLEPRSF
ncbi:hypothetical protein [Malacoplasma muris]